MEDRISGLHHITVVASDPVRNRQYYTEVLGLRMIKKTVNFDDPSVYHLYFGDSHGSPGTLITFFPFPDAQKGKRGTGEVSITSYAVPKDSLDFWAQRFQTHGYAHSGAINDAGVLKMRTEDPDGMGIELVEEELKNPRAWKTADIPSRYAIQRFYGITINLKHSEPSIKLLEQVFGFEKKSAGDDSISYSSGEGLQKARLNITLSPDQNRAIQGAGSVHHVAWRTNDLASQKYWMETLKSAGYRTTDMIDRNYFSSIYFREPGGVLFEIATDGPGFTIDEDLSELGAELKLPEFHEPYRKEITANLIPLDSGSTREGKSA